MKKLLLVITYPETYFNSAIGDIDTSTFRLSMKGSLLTVTLEMEYYIVSCLTILSWNSRILITLICLVSEQWMTT